MSRLHALVFGAAALVGAGDGRSAETDPLPVPKQGARANAVQLYNDGVALLLQRNFAGAQKKFEAALTLDEQLAEAHNNLAYTLRMQGRHNFRASLAHYNRAIELKPMLSQAYSYRGTLFALQGDFVRARQDLDSVRKLDARLAADLERAIAGALEAEKRGGIAAQIEY